MRKKRLQHTAYTICNMFCGWRIYNSTYDLNKLGSGLLKYDFLSKNCSFNEEPIEVLSICAEVEYFLDEELNRIGVERSSFKNIVLFVIVQQKQINAKERVTNPICLKNKKPINQGIFYQYHFNCKCVIETDEITYEGNLKKIDEWPENWP